MIENHHLRFLLSGSSARKLKKQGVNLLAGRALLRHFFPLVSSEVQFQFDSLDSYLYGMLPVAFMAQLEDKKNYLESYAQLYLKEEIQAEALVRHVGFFSRFLEIVARQNAQLTHLTNIAREAQVARQTVQTYFDILTDTLMGFWLPAWKLKKTTKQVQHPKFYFFDAGVVRALSGRMAYALSPEEQGFLFETYLINEVRAYLSLSNLKYPLFYWSSYNQVEVDLLFETQDGCIALEIKSSRQWSPTFNRGLSRIAEDPQLKKLKKIGIFQGPRALEVQGVKVFPFMEFLQLLWKGELFR